MKLLVVLAALSLAGCATAPKAEPAQQPIPKLAKNDTFYAGCVNTYIRLANVPAEKGTLKRAGEYCRREIARIGVIK